MSDYTTAKARILNGAQHAVLNAADDWVSAMALPEQPVSWFGDGPTESSLTWQLSERERATWLCHEQKPVMAAADLPVIGRHNALNALAALAIGHAAGWPEAAMRTALQQFEGLPHRGESLGVHAERLWVNDSKATNVAAAIAAVRGLDAPVVFIAGGQGKGQDFAPLAPVLAKTARAAVLYGQDAHSLAQVLSNHIPVTVVDSLQSASAEALAYSAPGDVILLAPACASLDQFANYQARGECFRALVAEVADA